MVIFHSFLYVYQGIDRRTWIFIKVKETGGFMWIAAACWLRCCYFPRGAVQRGQKETVKALSRRRMHISYNWGIFTNPIAAADSCSTSWMPDLLALHRQDQVAYLPSWAPLRWKLPLQQKAARMFWSLADKVTCTQLENGPRYNMIQRTHGSDWQLFV